MLKLIRVPEACLKAFGFFFAIGLWVLPLSAAAADEEVRLTLFDAVSAALKYNESVQEGTSRIVAAEASRLGAKGAYDATLFNTSKFGRFEGLDEDDYDATQLRNATTDYFQTNVGIRQRVSTGASLSAYYTYSKEHMLGTLNQTDRSQKNYLTLEFTQSLLKGIFDKEQQAAIEKATLSIADSEESKKLIVSRLILDVIRAYWALDVSLNNQRVALDIFNMADRLYKREVVRFKQGISQGVDVDRANTVLKEREYTLVQYKRDTAVMQDRLKLLLNSPEFTRETNIIPSSPLNRTVIPTPDSADSYRVALENRYELRQIGILLKQLGLDLDVSANSLLPKLDLLGGVTTPHGNDFIRTAENFKDTDQASSWYVGMNFSYPLQNRTARGEYDKNAALIKIAQDRLSKTQRGIYTELQEAIHNLALAKKGIPIAHQTYISALNTVKGEKKRFEMGGVNNRDLLASFDALGREEMKYHIAVVNYNVALAEYSYACATLLDKMQVEVTKKAVTIR